MTAKKPPASARRLTAANLEALGAESLSALLLELADSQPALKRRLRMELSARVGAEALAEEIDKRLTMIAGSKAKVSWRKRPEFILDLTVLRRMIAGRLADLDAAIAMRRLWTFLDLADGLSLRVKDPKGELDQVFVAAAQDMAELAPRAPADIALAGEVADMLFTGSAAWSERLGPALSGFGQAFGAAVLAELNSRIKARPAFKPSARVMRAVADAAGDVDAFVETVPATLLRDPGTAAAVGRRLLAAGRPDEARATLLTADPRNRARGLDGRPDPAAEPWYAVWIETLEQAGDLAAAHEERWATFERTLSAAQLRRFLKVLPDFDDVEAMDRAFGVAARFTSFGDGLAFLMDWPALPEAAAMILARRDEAAGEAGDLAEWAARLDARYPAAALVLLRTAISTLWSDPRTRDEAEPLADEAEALARRIGDLDGLESHEAFALRLTARRSGSWRR
ncbi:MAG: hypothetical protein Q8L66_11660 [Caulobacter sp.]|nr:hypothetical protein [Caulobacter sp.]